MSLVVPTILTVASLHHCITASLFAGNEKEIVNVTTIEYRRRQQNVSST
jgi:hypothetical protein